MKKSILNLGKVLNKAEQKTINGGGRDSICLIICGGNKTLCDKKVRDSYYGVCFECRDYAGGAIGEC